MSSFRALPPPPKTRLGRRRQLSARAGVKVSPICLRVMSTGDKWAAQGMGSMDKESSFKLFDAFYDAGANFVDTENNNQDESFEEFFGEWMVGGGVRDQMVIATTVNLNHFTTNFKRAAEMPQKTQFGGDNVKSLHVSAEASLKKFCTDYVVVLCVHKWDFDITVEEVMGGLYHLVAARKVLSLLESVSDTHAWVVSKANQYARDHGKAPFVIYQGA